MNRGFAPPSWDPPVDVAALEELAGRCGAAGLTAERDRPIGVATTLGVGGAARVYVELADRAAAQAFSAALSGFEPDRVPLFVLGKGSNTLVSDDGFPGVVVHLGAGHKWIRRDGLVVGAGAGEAMPALAAWTAREGLSGLEFAAGIPATVGGSVRMNAGAHGGEVATRLVRVEAVVNGTTCDLRPSELGFAYRHSALPIGAVVLGAHWELAEDDPVAIRHRLDELRAWRRATQPLRERNCGSVFTNPAEVSAGAAVEAAGGKGLRVGGATVSRKHANFITVRPGARAQDVHDLIALVRARVVERGGPLLVPEVRLIGRF